MLLRFQTVLGFFVDAVYPDAFCFYSARLQMVVVLIRAMPIVFDDLSA